MSFPSPRVSDLNPQRRPSAIWDVEWWDLKHRVMGLRLEDMDGVGLSTVEERSMRMKLIWRCTFGRGWCTASEVRQFSPKSSVLNVGKFDRKVNSSCPGRIHHRETGCQYFVRWTSECSSSSEAVVGEWAYSLQELHCILDSDLRTTTPCSAS